MAKKTVLACLFAFLTAIAFSGCRSGSAPKNAAEMDVPAAVDKAAYESQSPLDEAHVEAGSEFDVTWFLRNTGTTTWTTNYSLRYFTGTNLTKPGKQRYNLNQPVEPNEIGACGIDAIAPMKAGTYNMAVVLANENDENFFIADITIVVDIPEEIL